MSHPRCHPCPAKFSTTYRVVRKTSRPHCHPTCLRFHSIILQNVGTLPTRLVCELVFDTTDLVHLYRAPAWYERPNFDRRLVAQSSWVPQKIQEMYEMFGRKTTIRKVKVTVQGQFEPDRYLVHLIKNFPSVTRAVSLHVDIISYYGGLPTDTVLDRFERLQTIAMYTFAQSSDHPSFWSDLFATKTFRRVIKFRVMHAYQFPAVDDGELFDFITDVSRMPADKPRVIQFVRFDTDSLDALERRFNENIDSIAGPVCAVIRGHEDQEARCFTNMAVGNEKKSLAVELLHNA